MPHGWIASRYTRTAEHLMPAARECLGRLAPACGEVLLDVATGTGNGLVAAGPGVRGIGFDSSADQLAVARQRCEGFAVELHEADAERLPLPDGQVDLAVSLFGLIFAADPFAALQEMVRCVRPGGRIGVTALRQDGWPAQARAVLARHVGVPSPAMPTVWSDTVTAAAAARDVGLSDVDAEICELRRELAPLETLEDLVDGFAIMAELRERLVAAQLWEPARLELADLLAGPILIDRYVLFTGTVPDRSGVARLGVTRR